MSAALGKQGERLETAVLVIFTRSYDFLAWLLPVTNHFPRAHRFTLTSRLLDAAFTFGESIQEANLRKGRARLERLHHADEALSKVRYYLRLAARWDWISAGQYQHVSKMVDEIGRLLGGWQKATSS